MRDQDTFWNWVRDKVCDTPNVGWIGPGPRTARSSPEGAPRSCDADANDAREEL